MAPRSVPIAAAAFALAVAALCATTVRALSREAPGAGGPAAVCGREDPPRLVPTDAVETIASGGVAVLEGFVPAGLVERLRADATGLQEGGHFRPDGLTNNALATQGFTRGADRQTFRNPETGEQSWYRADLGDASTRLEFDRLLAAVRIQLARDLDRPTLLGGNHNPNSDEDKDNNNDGRHEITYNWYEPGARLGRHLDEHHEETKGPRGWRYPSRRSVTWLVYLNDHWKAEEGGALLCHPRNSHGGSNDDNNNKGGSSANADTNASANSRYDGDPIGSHEGNLQVGWIDGFTPVYLDAFRESGQTALYSLSHGPERRYWTERDFDVPAQPIEFGVFLPEALRPRFEQISTARNDPRFAAAAAAASPAKEEPAAISGPDTAPHEEAIRVVPAGGTLVLFDSVTLPHSVLEVTGKRQRIAATGWFHEDSQFALPV